MNWVTNCFLTHPYFLFPNLKKLLGSNEGIIENLIISKGSKNWRKVRRSVWSSKNTTLRYGTFFVEKRVFHSKSQGVFDSSLYLEKSLLSSPCIYFRAQTFFPWEITCKLIYSLELLQKRKMIRNWLHVNRRWVKWMPRFSQSESIFW